MGFLGIVKQVISGDSFVLREKPQGGPPPEKTIGLSNIAAPRLAKRPGLAAADSPQVHDEPFAWEAREFVRKLLIGEKVYFDMEYRAGNDKEFGVLYLGTDSSGPNIAELLVTEGLVSVRRQSIRAESSASALITLEDAAIAAGRGIHSLKVAGVSPGAAQEHVRHITWTIDDPRAFVDSTQHKPIDAIIEHVRDGCTVRAFLLPTFHYVTIMLSGIKSPMFTTENTKPSIYENQALATEAKFCVEKLVLNREVRVILEGVSNNNLLGTVFYSYDNKECNLAKTLLVAGYAHCVDWSMGVVTQGQEELREAEKLAKQNRSRIWKNFIPKQSDTDSGGKESFVARVTEVTNGDGLVVRNLRNGQSKKIFLASVRPPRPGEVETVDHTAATAAQQRLATAAARQGPLAGGYQQQGPRPRPLYDIPYMWEAREFLRKRLVGKKVKVEVDYIQPEGQGFPAKTCCTVLLDGSGQNVAEALILQGFATVVRYRADDDNRSTHFDALLSAEAKAKKNSKGIHSGKATLMHVQDTAGDPKKASAMLPLLKSQSGTAGIIEFVASGSRFRVFIEKSFTLCTVLLSGIDCPRPQRTLPSGEVQEGQPFGDEAHKFSRDHYMQQDVRVEFDSIDKGGNFIGFIHRGNVNISVELVRNGLARVNHFIAKRTQYYNQLQAAEDEAVSKNIGIWPGVKAEEEANKILEDSNSVVPSGNQLFDGDAIPKPGPRDQLSDFMRRLNEELRMNAPTIGAFTPNKRSLCVAQYIDKNWYRAKIEKYDPTAKRAEVFYVDYGNRATVSHIQTASLPTLFRETPPFARPCQLAYIDLPPEPDDVEEAFREFRERTNNIALLMNVEYKEEGTEFVTITSADNEEADIGRSLVHGGMVLAKRFRSAGQPRGHSPTKPIPINEIHSKYIEDEAFARNGHIGIWRYGDFTGVGDDEDQR